VDILNLRVREVKFKKLEIKDLLALKVVEHLSLYEEKNIPNDLLFIETNYVLNLFIFLHECGHLNQKENEEYDTTKANHFSEFNADYFALSIILQYYHTLKLNNQQIYWKKVAAFDNEHNFIRTIITSSMFVIFLEVISKFNSVNSKSHPAIKKRFCYLLFQVAQQLNTNFKSLFITFTLKDFIVDIFNTMRFLENNIFEEHNLIFGNVLNFCITEFQEIQTHLESSNEFKKFNT